LEALKKNFRKNPKGFLVEKTSVNSLIGWT